QALLNLPDDGGSFRYVISAKEGRLQCIIWLELKQRFFPPGQYPALREFFATIEQKLQEQIVLHQQP
ncbi:MAG: hypothetical protein KDC54_13365, partial [Lewinella sp.]|nr:hypothetical protein [Lewinella sp.]